MKKIALILSSLFLLSSPAFACPASESKGAVDFNTKVKFSAARITDNGSFKSANVFSVKGMKCASCVKKVESAVSGVKGVKSVKVDLKNGKAMVVYNTDADQKAIASKISKAVEKSGFKANKV